MCQVLHDFLGLMEYILEELPLHVPALEDIFMKLKGGQDRLRWLDWICLTTTHVLQDILAALD